MSEQHFKLTDKAKQMILQGAMGDITEGIPFDNMTVRLTYDKDTDTYRMRWANWRDGEKISEFVSEPFGRANVFFNTEDSVKGAVTFKLL